jgi:hypothetical protein
MIEAMPEDGLKGNYNFRIEMRNTIEFIGTEYAFETNQWIKALNRAKKTQEEIDKSNSMTLFRNTDIFVAMYRRKMGTQIKERVSREAGEFLDSIDLKTTEIPEFIEKLEKAHDHLAGVKQNFLNKI